VVFLKAGYIYANSVPKTVINPSKMPETVARQNQTQTPGKAFGDLFTEQLEAGRLQFSKHANSRLNSREIALSDAQLERVESGVQTARAKGINDSLVLVDEVALVVNTLSKTVITVMEKGNDNIFTNIDGAVIV